MGDQTKLVCVITLVSLLIIVVVYLSSCSQEQENYNHYRGTGNCTFETGRRYLDAYDMQDLYRKFPYVYPTPLSYTKAWYAIDREKQRYFDAIRHGLEVRK